MSGTTEPRLSANTHRRLPGPARRRQLLSVARRHFANHGFHRSTMEDIATAADITKPVLYQHFSSKTELYEAVLDSRIELFEHQVITPLLLDLDGRERTRRMISNFMSVVIDDPAAYRLIFLSDMRGQEQCRSKIDGLVERVSGRLSTTMQETSAIPAPESDFLAHSLVMLAIGAAETISANPSPSVQKRQEFLLFQLVWGGVDGLDGA
ncbi:TetR/AcrR family transcriptional regulator [uncultured Kocuria sp.]|uniref:TetR/AcrR family transcriptional regulator n=1 Tax=uncultured Kocuria sp. TaxID=259305 RepID=UPI0025996851|nr:TetR/AcrR family transcriptional regulator [uncultured Kocuria sp.]MCT1367509.1 TetR/AcrR family transcriptional regulator [Rothia sp. p3-SID1597]